MSCSIPHEYYVIKQDKLFASEILKKHRCTTYVALLRSTAQMDFRPCLCLCYLTSYFYNVLVDSVTLQEGEAEAAQHSLIR